MERTVVLCNESGEALGECGLTEAHENGGKLHRAFSVLVFRNNKSEVLIQKRAADKPLFANRWANACCSHPFAGEDAVSAGQRRLQEELGFTTELNVVGSFVYQADDPDGALSENEHDTVLVGEVSGELEISPDPCEVSNYRWIKVDDLINEIKESPEGFGPWLLPALNLSLALT